MFKNFSQMMKQAQKMKEDMEKIQIELEKNHYEGTSGAGLVKITINGQHRMINLEIDPSLFKEEDQSIISDLVIAAFNDALDKAKKNAEEKMGKVAGGLDLSKLPF
jgi:DNA-binding YbaB/EbfC family protein